MLHLFLGLKSLVKVSRYHTDGSVFRLHYRVTVMALLAFTFIVTTRQYIGKDKCRQFVFYIVPHTLGLKNEIEKENEQQGRKMFSQILGLNSSNYLPLKARN